MQLASFGPLVSFFLLFLLFFHTNSIVLDYIHVLTRQGGLGWAALTRTGPNDVACVVWAISEFFSTFSVVFHTNSIVLDYIHVLTRRGGLGWAALTRTGH